ncbi:MAG: hypothetical protein DDT23_00789 [candidate division WS2 bacterium]|nr:hypothetical protein [Candidatus Lithacetigena glycinireducens]
MRTILAFTILGVIVSSYTPNICTYSFRREGLVSNLPSGALKNVAFSIFTLIVSPASILFLRILKKGSTRTTFIIFIFPSTLISTTTPLKATLMFVFSLNPGGVSGLPFSSLVANTIPGMAAINPTIRRTANIFFIFYASIFLVSN